MAHKIVKRVRIEREARDFIGRTSKIGQAKTSNTVPKDVYERAAKESARMIAQLIETNGSRVVD